ncbi:hypothetical protein [Pedobacter aquatilis]|uniref:hypothetical protein n=1 Tax=Pedobacter aquatilis TaxID=351343 RepID=UPI002931B2DE|nr:hypothetical protein [Pedobacter aquatilis]
MGEKYVASGAASVSGIFKTILFGILASFVLPIIYIILLRLLPNIWVNTISAVLLGISLGYFIDLGIKIGKIRNLKIAIAIAIFCGLLACYNQWVLFDTIMYSAKGFTFKLSGADINILLRDFIYLFTHPGILFEEIKKLNEYGTFRIKGSSNVSGALLWIVWIGEFLTIFGSIVFTVANGQAARPFSENNDAWMTRRKFTNRINYVDNKEAFLNEIDRRNYNLLKHNEALLDHENFAEVVVYEYPGEPSKYINIVNAQNTIDKKGKITSKRKNIILQLQLLNADV